MFLIKLPFHNYQSSNESNLSFEKKCYYMFLFLHFEQVQTLINSAAEEASSSLQNQMEICEKEQFVLSEVN